MHHDCRHGSQADLDQIKLTMHGCRKPIMNFVGASPDAVVLNADNNAVAVIEIKCRCPFTYSKGIALRYCMPQQEGQA